MESKEELDVISITGMPGLGKTTLARTILHNVDVVARFPLRIWIHVSQNLNSRDIFLDILKRLVPQATSSPSEEELISTVRGCLAKERFLLVMDDVWTVEDWKVIKKILPTNNSKAKVLVTSRDKTVAARASSESKMHELQPLGPIKSWELLKLNVFGKRKRCPQELENTGQAIASNCGGSPLIIGVIAGILKDQIAEKWAIPALQTEWLKLSTNISRILKTDKESSSISEAVELSYRRLPDKLRMCFLYTGLFPDNHEIPTSTLTLLWIAEGFIPSEDGKTFEATAYKFLRDLINMNLLMVEKMSLDHVKTCRVHDTIREFCKAKAVEENLFTLVKRSEEGIIEPSVTEVQKFRRLCLHSDLSRFLSEEPNGPRVRSFLCFFKQSFDLDPKHISAIPDAFNLLRVLNCKSVKFGQFPKVTKLILLKHITLFVDNFDVLPEQISQLLNLQTLIVETNSRSITVKANIWKMTQLRRLKTKAAIFLDDKKWKGEARENLQAVSRLSPVSCTAALSDRASNLKSLGIRGKLADLFDTFTLERFRHLEKLKLLNDLVHESASNYPLLALPQSDRFPPFLKRLTLSNTYLLWDRHMPILAKINTLEVLKLKDDAFSGISWHARGDGFQSLQYLLLENSELVIWEASAAHFPSLRWLELKICKKLQRIPAEVAGKLEKLDIDRVKQSATDSARAIKLSKTETEGKREFKFGVPFKLNEGAECNL